MASSRRSDTSSSRRRGRGSVSAPSGPGRRDDRRGSRAPATAPTTGPRQSRPASSASGSGSGGGSRRAAGGPFARRSTRRLAALGAVFVLLAIMIVPTLRAYLQQRAEYAALSERITLQEQSIGQLQAQLKQWDDPAYVEQQARDRLKFVRPGETSYQVIGAEKLLGDPLAGRSRVVVPNQGDDSIPWYGKMWSSIVIADRPDVDKTVELSPVGEQPGSTPSPGGTSGAGGTSDPTGSSAPSGTADSSGTSGTGATGTSGTSEGTSEGTGP